MVQLDLVRLASRGGRLTVVGDPDQSIYGCVVNLPCALIRRWRQADSSVFKRVAQDCKGAVTVRLCQSYRSTSR